MLRVPPYLTTEGKHFGVSAFCHGGEVGWTLTWKGVLIHHLPGNLTFAYEGNLNFCWQAACCKAGCCSLVKQQEMKTEPAWALFSFIVCFCTAVWKSKTKVYLHSMDMMSCSDTHAYGPDTSGFFSDFSHLIQQKCFTFLVAWHVLICWVIFVCLFSPHC